MKQGTQIAYIPTHAEGDLSHPDVEFGFVISEHGNSHFCRYWRNGELGTLRTTANSELTPTDNLVKHNSVSQVFVNYLLVELGYVEAA